jgi:hypothetical protein
MLVYKMQTKKPRNFFWSADDAATQYDYRFFVGGGSLNLILLLP